MIKKSLRCATRPVAEKRRRGEGDDEDWVGCSLNGSEATGRGDSAPEPSAANRRLSANGP
jgi:hypothetical protein